MVKGKPAAVWKRILAFLLDLYLALAVGSTLVLLVVPDASLSVADAIADPTALVTPVVAAAFLYLSLIILLYHVACEYVVGQTPGMLLFGLSIRNTRQRKDGTDGKTSARGARGDAGSGTGQGAIGNLTFFQALVRNLFLLPLFPFYLLWLVEPLFYVFQGERLLEYWSRTETIE